MIMRPLCPGNRVRYNPFNPSTEIRFSIERESPVKVEIFNPSGRRIRLLLDGAVLGAGTHRLAWDGKSDAGREVSSGVYFYRIETPGFEVCRKMVLLR